MEQSPNRVQTITVTQDNGIQSLTVEQESGVQDIEVSPEVKFLRGFSPVIDVEEVEGGYLVTMTDAEDTERFFLPVPDVSDEVSRQVGQHNVSTEAHADVRLLIEALTERLNALADSDDDTLDQLSEIVAYIKANRELVESVTNVKVNVSDIVDNLVTNVGDRPLSAAQGVALKALIDAITVPTKVSQLENDKSYATTAQLDKKADDYSIQLYNGTKGNPKPVKFATVDYSTCNGENGVAAKIGLVSGHGNGTSYAFLEDVIIRVNYNGGIEVDNLKYYAADASTYDGAKRKYGDIFWVHDADNKNVAFYVLMGQYARVNQIPWKRLTYSSGGTVTQHTSASVYESGDKVWANNSEFVLSSDLPEPETWTFTLDDGTTVTKEVYAR